MQTISEVEAREHLANLFDEVVRAREPITITRNGQDAAVLVPADDFAALNETLHLLSTSANAERIRRSLADYNAGKLHPGALCD